MWKNRLDVDLRPPFLQLAALAFRFENSFLQRGWSRRFSSPLFFAGRNLGTKRRALSIFDCVEQSLARQFSIRRLRTRVLTRVADSARPMPQRHRGRNFVYVLAAGAA